MVDHYTTKDGIRYEWEGPVGEYADDKRVPEVRHRVKVAYLNMSEEQDREQFGKIMSEVKNGRYVLVSDPVYTTPENGHQHITIVYDYQFACDPNYCEDTGKNDKSKQTEVSIEQKKNKNNQEKNKDVQDQYQNQNQKLGEQQIEENLGPNQADYKTIYKQPENSIRMGQL